MVKPRPTKAESRYRQHHRQMARARLLELDGVVNRLDGEVNRLRDVDARAFSTRALDKSLRSLDKSLRALDASPSRYERPDGTEASQPGEPDPACHLPPRTTNSGPDGL